MRFGDISDWYVKMIMTMMVTRRSRSSFVIATGHGMYGQGSNLIIDQEFFYSTPSRRSRPALRPTKPPIQ
jgi:hypothetical protein